jgi:hypothetical protein
MEVEQMRDYAVEVLRKFRRDPAPNKELLDQLKTLPDEEVELFRDTYPKLVKG